MNNIIKNLAICAFVIAISACATSPTDDDGGEIAADTPATDSATASPDNGSAQQQNDADLTLEDAKDGNQAENALQPEPVVQTPPPEPTPAPPVVETPPPAPPAPVVEVPKNAKITDVKFRENDTGGAIIISGDGPLNFTSRMNGDSKQFVIEVSAADLPSHLKRTLNALSEKGYLGSISAQQAVGTNTVRFVVQLKDGAAEPVVQQEGSSLLVLGGAAPKIEVPIADTNSDDKVLSGQNLENFLAGNQKFYGKKISIEMNNVEVRDALRFITDESGLNMVISDDIKGTVSLKLRQIPWDQALVILMKAKKLSYTRTGNILRIAPVQELKQEEDDATKLALSRRQTEQLKVRVFSISYTKVDELEGKIKSFLSDRGKVISDVRTNSVVVTDIEDNLNRVSKLIQSLDTQPPQVLIEGKIVEARESFTRTIGVNWGFSGSPIKMGKSGANQVFLTPSLSVTPQVGTIGGTSNSFGAGINLGTLDIFGDLNALLALNEREEKVKVISSPRIVTMTNEKASISQVTQVPVIKTDVANGVTTISTSFVDLPLKLDVTPQITSDSSIIMKVNVQRKFQGAIIDAKNNAFSVHDRSAETRVLVQNGQTAVIGGVYVSDVTEAEGGVPWLRELPVFGWLFKGKNSTKEKQELLIFLTPKILGQVGGASQNGEL